MEKQIAQFTNRGMYQDVSVSKATNEFAFENLNIKITALEDNTLFTVTNVKEPRQISSISGGTYLGHCVLGRYVVVFIKGSTVNTDKIVRLDYNGESFVENQLYIGNLGFNNPIECLPYYESEEVQKVYWVDGENFTRVINIKNVKHSNNNDTQFDFNPKIKKIPNLSVSKEYEGVGMFPSGIIQYGISYYNKYGTETPLVVLSDINYIDYENRAGSPTDLLNCSFRLNISNIDTSFDYLKVYSIKRTSLNGDIIFNNVRDINIENKETIEIIDDNLNQETLDPSLLFFIGGKEFYCSTIAQKNDTLFFGDIRLSDNPVDTTLTSLISSTIKDNNGIKDASLINFGTKEIQLEEPKGYYAYKRQSNLNSNSFKTFKSGEIYRFAIQFQTKRGEWTSPTWIGDKTCDVTPNINEETNTLTVANPVCVLTNDIIAYASNVYSTYRILMADTSNNRSILAQGVVCPTVFNYEERVDGNLYAQSSWIMRPRGSNASWQHMNHTADEIQCGNNLAPVVTNGDSVSVDSNIKEEKEVYDSYMIGIVAYKNKNCLLTLKEVHTKKSSNDQIVIFDESKPFNTLIIKNITSANTWSDTYSELKKIISETLFLDLETNLGVSFDKFKSYATWSGLNVQTVQWNYLEESYIKSLFYKDIPKDNRDFLYTLVPFADAATISNKLDSNLEEKKNNYYIDNSIITFHSPELEDNSTLFKNNNLNFRIVGIVPITSNYSDVDIELKTKGLSSAYSINKNSIKNKSNLSKITSTLTSSALYRDFSWEEYKTSEFTGYVPTNILVDYIIYMWHKQGSLVGQNEKTVHTENLNSFDNTIADLKRKTFATQRFSYKTEYVEPWHSNISKTQYFDSDNIELLQLDLINDTKIFYSGNYDKLLTTTKGYKVGELLTYDPVRIKYKSTPHVVFSLQDEKRSSLNTLPQLANENEDFSELYDLNSAPNYPWQTTKYYPKSKIKTFGFYNFPKNGTLTDNDVSNIWENIKTYYIGENRVSNILYQDKESSFYIFLCDMNAKEYVGYPDPVSLSGIIKFTTSDNALKLGNYVYGKLSDFPELENLAFDLCEIIDGKPIVTPPSKVMPSIDDYKQGTFIQFKKNIYTGNLQFSYVTKDIVYKKTLLNSLDTKGYSYLYLAELYKDIEYENLYGGYGDNALESINWIPITNSTDIDKATEKAEGDTYYQRWDCLKTYPYTEEDINSVVDITSFMVETHINLEGRYDKNIGTTNILYTRPTNFNLYNEVYSQPNNIFSYNVLDAKYYNKDFKNQIAWSLQKTPTSEIDTWTNISLASALNLDGSYGKITKLINNNDTILAFQDKAISAINFNNRTALSTENGVPIEIANSGKVDGYKVITDTIGCQNKQLMTKANSGLYFIDGLNKSLFSIGADGVKNVSNNGMSVWFRNNIDNITELTYDGLSKDVYVLTSTKTLLYNEDLGNFTTFLDFVTDNYSTIFNMEGRAIGFNQEGSSIAINEMNVGDYNYDYRITYRINPEPFLDKTFTNIEYIANFDNNINNPFKKLIAENEYQYGTSEIVNTKYPTDYKKFRIWRFDVPRDDNTARTINGRTVKLDRIRNPWFNLTLVGNDSIDNNSMEFHNLNVYYYR